MFGKIVLNHGTWTMLSEGVSLRPGDVYFCPADDPLLYPKLSAHYGIQIRPPITPPILEKTVFTKTKEQI